MTDGMSAPVGRAGRFVPLTELAGVLGRPVRLALLERRSKRGEDTKSIEVQHDALVRFVDALPVGSYQCDHARLAEDGGDVYRQIVSAWRGDGKHKLLRRVLADLSRYDAVLVHRMDRFGRQTSAVFTALKDMADAGVRLYSVEQGIDTADPKQQFNAGLYVLLAQQSSDLSSDRIRENKALAKQRGGWRGGAITYGFRKAMTMTDDGTLVAVRDSHGYKTLEHDPDEVGPLLAVISRIVDGGSSVAAAVRWLNAQDVPSPRGLRQLPDGSSEQIRWTVTGLKRILMNPALMGFDVVGVGKHRFQKLIVDGRPHRPHPPVLTDERWHALQQAIAGPTRRRRAATEALLAGLVVCLAHRGSGEVCGRRMYGPGTITSNSASYACRTSGNLAGDDPERCAGNAISARWLQRLVELVVLGIAADPRWQQALRQAYGRARAAAQVDAAGLGDELADLQRRMSDLRQEKEVARSQSRRAEVARDIDAVDVRIAELENLRALPATVVDVDIDFAARWVDMTVSQRRAMITDLVERIEIAAAVGRGRGFDPSRVRVHLRNVGVFHIAQPVDLSEQLDCPECSAPFATPAALGVHRRHKHGVIGSTSRRPAGQRTVYPCPHDGCDRRTTSAGGLKRHVAAAHRLSEALVCPLACPKVFRTAVDLASHLRQSHTARPDEAPAVCDDCGKVLKGPHGLRVHRGRVHPTDA